MHGGEKRDWQLPNHLENMRHDPMTEKTTLACHPPHAGQITSRLGSVAPAVTAPHVVGSAMPLTLDQRALAWFAYYAVGSEMNLTLSTSTCVNVKSNYALVPPCLLFCQRPVMNILCSPSWHLQQQYASEPADCGQRAVGWHI